MCIRDRIARDVKAEAGVGGLDPGLEGGPGFGALEDVALAGPDFELAGFGDGGGGHAAELGADAGEGGAQGGGDIGVGEGEGVFGDQ